MDINYYLGIIAQKGELSSSESEELFSIFLSETDADFDSELAIAYLFSTSIREIQVAEFLGAARIMRRKMAAVPLEPILGPVDILDTCGTGGSGLNPFNTSTAVALICAAAGVYTAKHGNRAASSQSGSADVLQALGVNISTTDESFLQCISKTHFGFLFAPSHHPAARKVAPLRKKLGVRTIFNYLGPILNPAHANLQLLGVSNAQMQKVIADALLALGTKRAFVVRGEDGLDEITLNGRTLIYKIENGSVTSFEISPEEFGFKRYTYQELAGAPATEAAQMMRDIFAGANGPRTDLVLFNAGAALYVAGVSNSIYEGITLVRELISSGKVSDLLLDVIAETNAQS